MIKNLKVNNIEDRIKKVNNICLERGSNSTHIYAGSEFEPLCAEMSDLGISLNCASKKEHVHEIEQFNCTAKERVRSTQSAMTFKIIYKLMIVHLVATAIFWQKIFPPSEPGARLLNTKGPG